MDATEPELIPEANLQELGRIKARSGDLYCDVRGGFIKLRAMKEELGMAEDQKAALAEQRAAELKAIGRTLDDFGNQAAKSLGLIFSSHGTDEKLFVDMVDYYDDLKVSLTWINELLDKATQPPEVTQDEVHVLK